MFGQNIAKTICGSGTEDLKALIMVIEDSVLVMSNRHSNSLFPNFTSEGMQRSTFRNRLNLARAEFKKSIQTTAQQVIPDKGLLSLMLSYLFMTSGKGSKTLLSLSSNSILRYFAVNIKHARTLLQGWFSHIVLQSSKIGKHFLWKQKAEPKAVPTNHKIGCHLSCPTCVTSLLMNLTCPSCRATHLPQQGQQLIFSYCRVEHSKRQEILNAAY